ncbi:MAG: hypothetical protein HPY84_02775 [Syntrophobacteraceae bacterium]|jgi:hypothetical protein|nr:hypothetical protein [Syntrophobacteraceae bacterium]
MSERLMLKGALHEKKRECMTLAIRAQGVITGLKHIIQPASIVPLKDLKTDQALELMKELHELKQEYLQVSRDVDELEQELK